MIRFLLLQNRAGKTRLAKYYVPLDDDEKHQLEREVHRVVVNRDPKHTNFVEYRSYKIIYRRCVLYFPNCISQIPRLFTAPARRFTVHYWYFLQVHHKCPVCGIQVTKD
jgi:hypothetical protein